MNARIGRSPPALIAALMALVIVVGLGSAVEGAGRVPVPDLAPASKGEACVEPTAIIRRDHMKFLMHQRDRTVHDGDRTKRHSLIGCIDCHASKDDSGHFIPVNAPGQFCASCHTYAAVEIDCFGCHATRPASMAGNGG